MLVQRPEYFPEYGSDPGRNLFSDLQFLTFKLEEDPLECFTCQEIVKIGIHRFESGQPSCHTVGHLIPLIRKGVP